MPAWCFHSRFARCVLSIACAVQFDSGLAKGTCPAWPWQGAGSFTQGAPLLPCTPETAGMPLGVSSTYSKGPTSFRSFSVQSDC